MKYLRLNILALTVVALVFNQCKEDEDDEPTNLLLNSNIEDGTARPGDWLLSSNESPHELTWSEEEAFSPQRSLKISNPTESNLEVFTFWAQVVRQNIPFGKKLTLKAMIKSDLSGQGVSMAIRTDGSENSTLQFVTTQGIESITGTFDWTEYEISLEDVDSETSSIFVFLLYLEETTGEVYFDDVRLTVD